MAHPEEKDDLLRARSPGQVMALGMGAVALSYLCAGIVFMLDDEAPTHGVSILANLVGMIAVPLVYLASQRLAIVQSLRLRPVSVPQSLWIVGMIIAMIPTVLALGSWNQGLVPPPPDYLAAVEETMPDGFGEWIVAILSIVIIGPIAEEFVFRGMVQTAARRALGRWPALIFTAVTFAVWHGQLWNVAALVLVGLFLGLALEATGSLVASILAHASYNLCVLLIYDLGTTVPDLPTTAAAFGAACALAVAWAAYGRLRIVDPWPAIDRGDDDSEE